jgi:pimeloyl-ACP methyl ester carboxylesterase
MPPGRLPVGRRSALLLDRRRGRELPTTIWYPAAPGSGAPAPYMDEATAEAVAAALHLVAGFQARVRVHAADGAALAPGGPFPVVLLEHGSGSVPALYTVLGEGLASCGFVAVAANHPGESLVAVYPGGREIRFHPSWPLAAPPRLRLEAMGRYVEEVIVPDARFVLGRLGRMNREDPFWRGRLDLGRVGIVGHSLGGTAAAAAAREDQQILAAADLDGPAFPGLSERGRPIDVGKPLLLVEPECGPAGRPRDLGFVGTPRETRVAAIPGADHRSLSDSGLLRSRLSRDPRKSGGPAFARSLRTAAETASAVSAFFQRYLSADASAPGPALPGENHPGSDRPGELNDREEAGAPDEAFARRGAPGREMRDVVRGDEDKVIENPEEKGRGHRGREEPERRPDLPGPQQGRRQERSGHDDPPYEESLDGRKGDSELLVRRPVPAGHGHVDSRQSGEEAPGRRAGGLPAPRGRHEPSGRFIGCAGSGRPPVVDEKVEVARRVTQQPEKQRDLAPMVDAVVRGVAQELSHAHRLRGSPAQAELHGTIEIRLAQPRQEFAHAALDLPPSIQD